MHSDLAFYINSHSRLIYYVTEEEDRLLSDLSEISPKFKVSVFNAAWGLLPLRTITQSWETGKPVDVKESLGILEAFNRILSEPQDGNARNIYVITDPEHWLKEVMVQRRVLNTVHHLHNYGRGHKIFIFAGSRLFIPPKLQRYFEVVRDTSPPDEAVQKELADFREAYNPSSDVAKACRGLTLYEVSAAAAQSVCKTRHETPLITTRYVSEYKRKQLAKTDLLSYVDTSAYSFEDVGGNDLFKGWANKIKASWTSAGQDFGLVPPKGVLAVGVWGCGKSLSVKAMGNAWKLPVIQLEMGKLRSSAVGETEANIYRAISLIESVAPAVVWLDEAEKSLAGGHSSSMSDAGTTSRVIGILSNWIQETKSHVCLALTANSLDTLPVEFVNRMDERFFFDLPSEDDRIDILKIHLRKKGQDPTKYQLALLSDAAEGLVGREIEQAIGAAMVDSFDGGFDMLDQDVFMRELQTRPRIKNTMTLELQSVLDWVGYDTAAGDGVRARFASSRARKARGLK